MTRYKESSFWLAPKLYNPSTLNTDLIFWQPHYVVTILNHGFAVQANSQKPVHFLSAQMALRARKVPIVLGMYNFC